jgi:hypothetical protein
MKSCKILFVLIIIIFTQCSTPKEKFLKSDYTGDYPIKDLITEVPALNEKSIVPLVLENEAVKAVFDRNTGRMVSLVAKKTDWQLQRRRYLSRSFRLSVPVPGRRDNCVYGERQSQCSVEISNNNKKITFTWNKLTSECDKNLDIRFTGIVELIDGGLQFTANIQNNSPYTIEAVYWPYIGDLGVPKTQKVIRFGNEIYPNFRNHKGYFGADFPIQYYAPLGAKFGLLGNDIESLYTGYLDTEDDRLVDFCFELKPGYENSENTDYGTVPKTDSIAGKPVHIEFSCIHFTYLNSKETGSLKPVVLKPFIGDWQKGADIYKAWRKTWAKNLPSPEWATKVHSWQQFHINSSEDYPRCTYKDLIIYAKECAKHGVQAIQLTGWNLGGQDRGNPSHDIDPRLGTWDDLKNAIDECRKIGVHIILFAKFNWADESQPWFKDELIKYAQKDPYGNYYKLGGYQYQSAAGLAGIPTRRFIPMCHLNADWRKIADSEFNKIIDLGADGMLNDECQHHGDCYYCFDPSHGHHVPAFIYAGDILLEEGFRKIAAQKNPDFLFAGEAIRDGQFRTYNLSYTRISKDHVPMQRYITPYAQMMIAVIGYNDRHPINQALLYRYIISYEPRNFKGHLDEFPLTMQYGEKVDALRKRYTDFLWDGEFLGTVGASVKVNNDMKIYYSVFLNHKTNNRAIVVVNPSYDQPVTVQASLNNSKNEFAMVSPEIQEPKESNGRISIPALSSVVFMEK